MAAPQVYDSAVKRILTGNTPPSAFETDNSPDDLFYKPLRAANDEIRIFTLKPGAIGDPLEGFMFNASLERATSHIGFFALSYTWGEQSTLVPMIFEGHERLIGQNLAAALVSIRNEGEMAFVLWIDALCINQQDTIEKMDQVRKMKRIYESAKAVWVWLGDDFEGAGQAFAWLKALVEYTDVANS